MSDENRDPHFDPDTVSGMGGSDDSSDPGPLPIPEDLPIDEVIRRERLFEGIGTEGDSDEDES